ncbi:uncharacterized protein LOC104584887 isoform X1 [Brachypodium distachyon]|nr:uncharacterized protein LOC104584887 isoform X1 [Brachypodium distachyon]XP_024310911.1 uncharacterized protein LOC104584887 isoform X1 [Brachypodium distachyon]|eukprot:XP_024310910.1 uncharacterized protein LOC104584887 isoform X1 [Brachypodium distachyon]
MTSMWIHPSLRLINRLVAATVYLRCPIVLGAMVRKRDDVDLGEEHIKHVAIRNRASPFGLTKLYKHFNAAQKLDIRNMEFTPFLHINTTKLHNKVTDWLASCYDSSARYLLIPAKGRIPMTEGSVYNALGCPRGELPVPYRVDKDIEARLAPQMFPGVDLSKAPLHSQVNTMLKDMTESGNRFKRLALMYIMSTILAPTTSTRISNRCYPVLDDIANVHNYNFCKFVLDQLHENLSKKKLNKGCRLYLMLLYVDSLDISELGLDLPAAPFGVTAWTNSLIDEVLKAGTKEDGSFGKLQLISDHAVNYSYFGGPDQFSKWINMNSHPDIEPKERKKVETLMGQFASGMTCLLANLVQGWTGLTPP